MSIVIFRKYLHLNLFLSQEEDTTLGLICIMFMCKKSESGEMRYLGIRNNTDNQKDNLPIHRPFQPQALPSCKRADHR